MFQRSYSSSIIIMKIIIGKEKSLNLTIILCSKHNKKTQGNDHKSFSPAFFYNKERQWSMSAKISRKLLSISRVCLLHYYYQQPKRKKGKEINKQWGGGGKGWDCKSREMIFQDFFFSGMLDKKKYPQRHSKHKMRETIFFSTLWPT